ncbi:MAG: DUF3341 domain-containing protein [Luteolibacter sp.]|uniref:DUF3341 domain-containing protein n=1 Tax=Luteolibacter sp. TaxID=1962973 RepID=UPI00326393D2
MSHQSIFCIATSHFQANHIVDQLKIANIPDDGISALLADQSASRRFNGGNNLANATIAAAGAGAIIGVTWGWIAGIGALAIPGAGLFIAAGPIISAMSGATIGAALGGICGGLIGMGIPEMDAKRYEGKILKGDILLSVRTEDSGDIHLVEDIFNHAEALDIWTTCLAVAPSRAFIEPS